MRRMSRRELLCLIGAGGGLLGFGVAAGCGRNRSGNMMGGRMMGAASAGDMSTYMELFARHSELRRTVEEIRGGVRTITESEAPELVGQLQAHVASMYRHFSDNAEVTCMSDTLPTLFRNADSYRRHLTTTPRGVVVTETSSDPELTRVIREHAREVTGFVEQGMPAMMQSMMR
jgi:hypothetical protein